MNLPPKVKLVEVGPRDGLQNESRIIPTRVKINLIDKLSQTGLTAIESASFVSSKRLPQMADGLQVMHGLNRAPGVSYTALVPNRQGLLQALQAKASEIAIFTSVSETFSQRNLNCSTAQNLVQIAELCQQAAIHRLPVRGYISCVLGCPFEGKIATEHVAQLAAQLRNLGCYEISLGDTIGIGTPGRAQDLIRQVSQKVPPEHLAVHFHDTYGQALANILAVMECGISTIDSSVAGLGGCPFAPGATGNVASEDLLFMLKGLGIDTGVNLQSLAEAGNYICTFLGRSSGSRVVNALASQQSKN